MPPRYKEGGNYNIQYWNEEQGLTSPLVWAIMEDQKENIWLGTRGDGISKFDGNTFIHFTIEEGLTENAIRFLLEDSRGDIWIGTNKGACKYDGKSFTHFTENEGLTDRIVNYIHEDSQQNIWFGTFGGAIKYDGEYFTHYTKETGLSNDYVWSIFEDSEGVFWIGTDYGLNKFDGKNFTQYTTEEGLSNNVIHSIIEDKSGRLWLATLGGGINIFDGKKVLYYTKQQGLNYDFLMRVMIDSRGDIWIASYGGGVCKFDGENFIHYAEEEGMSGNYIRAIIEDKRGDIWFGAEKGVNKFAGENFKYFSKKDGLNDNYIISVVEDSKANIWLTTPKGANKFDGKTITQFAKKEGMSDDNVWYTLEDKNGDLWFSTWKGGVNKFDGKSFTHYLEEQGLTDNTIHVMLEDRNGVLWFGTNNGLTSFDGEAFTQYTEEEGLPFEKFSAIYEDSNGHIWFGFYGGGMLRFDGNTFFHFTKPDELINEKILNIHEDHLGNIWAGTVDGLYRFDGNSFKHYTVEDGLSSNTIWSITEDEENKIWIGTPEGITLMQLQADGEYQFFIFGKYEGVVNTNLIHGSAFLDSKNNLWWGTGDQLIRQDLNQDLQSDAKAPMVHINNIEINQQFIDYRRWVIDTTYRASFSFEKKIQERFDSIPNYGNYPSTLNLPFDINHITFNFSATDWIAPHKVKYSYIMQGLNEEWSLPSAENKADYRNIPFGNYTFKVRAIGAGEEWSAPLSYHFSIAPPWWHTWWARALYLLMGIGLVFGYTRWRTQRLKRQKEALERTVKDRTIELEAEKIRAEQEKERAEQSEKYKEQFLANMSHEIRTPMHAISGMVKILKRNEHLLTQDAFLDAMHTSSDNLVVILNDVLDLSKIEAGKLDIESIPMSPRAVIENITQILKYKAEEKGLSLNYQIDEELPSMIMGDPTRLNQILTNLAGNAIKFTEQGSVDILLTKENNWLKFAIRDTGIGIPKDKLESIFGAFEQAKHSTTRNYGGTGLGLNISKQLVELQNGKIWAESKEGKGSTFYVELPLVVAAADATSQSIVTEDKLKRMAASLEGIRILLAEDNPFNQMIAQDDLSFFIKDVKIEVVENGAQAVEKFRQGNYDLILMDVQMPEMNGFEATKQIREIETTEGRAQAIPIIAMTASLLKNEIDSCYKAGMDNYIPKPYKAEELIGALFSEMN